MEVSRRERTLDPFVCRSQKLSLSLSLSLSLRRSASLVPNLVVLSSCENLPPLTTDFFDALFLSLSEGFKDRTAIVASGLD